METNLVIEILGALNAIRLQADHSIYASMQYIPSKISVMIKSQIISEHLEVLGGHQCNEVQNLVESMLGDQLDDD